MRNDEIIAVRGREQCGVSIAGIAASQRRQKGARAVARTKRRRVVQAASRFPCSIPVERSQCRVTMAGMDHLFLLLGLSQSLLKIERGPRGECAVSGENTFLARSLACNAPLRSEKLRLESRRSRASVCSSRGCETSFSKRETPTSHVPR